MTIHNIHLAFLLALLALGCRLESEPEPPSPVGPPATSQAFRLIDDVVDGVPIAVVGSRGRNLIVAFDKRFRGEVLDLAPVQDDLPVVAVDQFGNGWDLFGEARRGPDQGSRLRTVNAGMGYWFVFGAMYPGLDIFGSPPAGAPALPEPTGPWAVPVDAVAQGSGFSAIGALDEPRFERFPDTPPDIDDPAFVRDDDLVIIVSLGGETKVYPHTILDWHEVVNDRVGGVPVTVTYCPLTGTGKVWRRPDAVIDRAFGVSGLLYNSNLLAFDRGTESIWTQLEARAVFGPRRGERLELVPFVETNWRSWRRVERRPLLMSHRTGIDRDYREFPYGGYRENDLIAYPLLAQDERLPLKERVFCVIFPGQQKVYRLDDF